MQDPILRILCFKYDTMMYFVSIAFVWNFQIIMNIKHWKKKLEKIKWIHMEVF
jgi:hypothetical protein